eukprot:382723_1
MNKIPSPNEIWIKSNGYKEILNNLKDKPWKNEYKPFEFNSVFATSYFYQMKFLLIRSWKFFIRNKIGVFIRLIGGSFLGFIFGLLYFNIIGWNEEYFKLNMFVSILFVTFVYCSESAEQEIPLFVSERVTLYRQIDSKFYNIITYYISRILAQFPLIVFQSILFVLFLYPMAYHNGPRNNLNEKIIGYFEYFIGVLTYLLTVTTFSQMLAVCTPNEEVGNVLYMTICTLCRIFSGYLILLSSMSDPFAPFSRFINGINFFKYGFFYLIGTQLPPWNEGNNEGETVWEMFREDQMIPPEHQDNPWVYYGGLIVFLFIWHLIAILVLKFKRWDKR